MNSKETNTVLLGSASEPVVTSMGGKSQPADFARFIQIYHASEPWVQDIAMAMLEGMAEAKRMEREAAGGAS